MSNILDGDVGRDSEPLVLRVVVGVLLEPVFDAILNEVVERFLGEKLGFPVYILLTPADSKMNAQKSSDFVPIRPCQDMKV